MTELQFVDELPEGEAVGERRTAMRADEYKANPNRWAPWPAKTAVSGVKKALTPYGPGFEVAGRKVDGKVVTFVRFVPVQAVASPASNGNGATRPPPASSGRPRVNCPTCHQFINIEAGEDSAKALSRHERTNTTCKDANRRRR